MFGHAGITCVFAGFGFFTMQQVLRLGNILYVGSRARQTVNLHAKMPLITFLARHIVVSLALARFFLNSAKITTNNRGYVRCSPTHRP